MTKKIQVVTPHIEISGPTLLIDNALLLNDGLAIVYGNKFAHIEPVYPSQAWPGYYEIDVDRERIAEWRYNSLEELEQIAQ